MALSGYSDKRFTKYDYLRLRWNATQSISGNYSDVTFTLELHSESNGAIYTGSVTKAAYITANGNRQNFNVNTEIGNNQGKVLASRNLRVNHDANGAKSFTAAAGVNFLITFAGAWISWVEFSMAIYLNTIPRTSSIASTKTQTPYRSALSFDINRATSSFVHKIDFKVAPGSSSSWTNILSGDGWHGYYISRNLNDGQRKTLNNVIGPQKDGRYWLRLYTYPNQSSSSIGYKDYYGTVEGADRMLGDLSDITVGKTGNIVYKELRDATNTTTRSEIRAGATLLENKTFSRAFTYQFDTSKYKDDIYKEMGPNSRTVAFNVKNYTYYDTDSSRYILNDGYNLTAAKFVSEDVKPSYVDGKAITYKDTNSDTVAVTGNNKYIIQGKSNLQITIPAGLMRAYNYAEMKEYKVTISGIEYKVNASDTEDMVINITDTSKENQSRTVTVTGVDTRGITNTVGFSILFIPYSNPSFLTTDVSRTNGYDDTIKYGFTISMPSILVGNVEKNATKSLEVKLIKDEVQVGSNNPSYTVSNNVVTVLRSDEANTFPLNTEEEGIVSVIYSDKLTTITRNFKIAKGSPLFFVDSEKKSVGIGKFPSNEKSFEMQKGGTVRTPYLEVEERINAKKGFEAISITNFTDFNDITDPGFYYAASNDQVQALKNAHPNMRAGSMIVLRGAGYRQIWYNYNQENFASFSRSIYTWDNDIWGSWKNLPNNYEIQTTDFRVVPDGMSYEDAKANKGPQFEIRLDAQYPYLDFHAKNDYKLDYTARIYLSDNGYNQNGSGHIAFNAEAVWFQMVNGVKTYIAGNQWTTAGTAANMYVRPTSGGSLIVMTNNSESYRPVLASAFTQKSAHSLKTDFKEIEEGKGLEIIRETDIVKYKFKSELDNQRIGFIINDDGKSKYKTHEDLYNHEDSSFNNSDVMFSVFLAVKELDKQVQDQNKIIESQSELIKQQGEIIKKFKAYFDEK